MLKTDKVIEQNHIAKKDNHNKFKPKNLFLNMVNDNKNSTSSIEDIFWSVNTKIRDLEEKQKILRDRLLLVGQNLIEIKEKTNLDMLEIKKSLELMKSTIERLVSFLEIASSEFQKFAKKEDIELLSKKIKIAQVLSSAEQRKK